jgi:hypothetical protein
MPKRSNLAGDARLYLSKNEMLDFQLGRTLSYQHYEGATNGEVARFGNLFRQRGGTRQAWVNTWCELGRQCRSAAEQAQSDRRVQTAKSLFLRAYNYLRAAEFFFNRVEAGAQAQRDLFDESVACFDAGIALTRYPPEKISIPYEGKVTLPGYFFKAHDDDVPRPTLIISGGGDGAGEEIYFIASVPDALERGLNVLLFHGPGQRGVMHQDARCVFRHDSEVWISKIVDYALSRGDVDPQKLALYGLSFGGYLTPRAAAHDARIKALIPNAPIRDFSSLFSNALRDQLPAYLRWLSVKTVIPLLEPAHAEYAGAGHVLADGH